MEILTKTKLINGVHRLLMEQVDIPIQITMSIKVIFLTLVLHQMNQKEVFIGVTVLMNQDHIGVTSKMAIGKMKNWMQN